jgi:hypothetical protein
MTILLDHVIVPARNRGASAKMLADLLGVPWSEDQAGPFTAVYVNDTLTLDFGQAETIAPHHFCFHVSDREFDAIFARIKAAQIPYRSQPRGPADMTVNTHGVLAPNAKLRSKIVPTPAERATEPPTDHAQGHGETPRMSWARLLKRVFDIDIEHCPNCGGALKIIAAIEDPPVIIKILSHLGLPTRAPPRAPARRVDLFQTI